MFSLIELGPLHSGMTSLHFRPFQKQTHIAHPLELRPGPSNTMQPATS
jgi:hypothetical protein